MLGRQGKPDPNWRVGRRDGRADRAMLTVADIVLCLFALLVIWAWLD